MIAIGRRRLIQLGVAAVAASPATGAEPVMPVVPAVRKNRIHQAVARWCYKTIPIDDLCRNVADLGLQGIDLLQPAEYEIPRRYGLRCTMGYAGGGEINQGLNRIENHAAIEAAMRVNIPLAAQAGVPNVITFSGLRAGLSDEEGARNCIAGLRRLKPIAEDHGVTINMELLNSKRDHKDYQCDHADWGVRVVSEVDSPRIKLLYDIYHMQIMEGDLITTIRTNAQWIGHYHTGGVPGRHELDDTQEVHWPAVMRAIAESGFTGYVAHEFLPTRAPLTSLAEAVDICNV
jgi:hydroxypyruvate isomerase